MRKICNIQDLDKPITKLNPFPPQYQVLIRRKDSGISDTYSRIAYTLHEALFYRNLVLDLIGDPRPDELEYPPNKYTPPATPEQDPKIQAFVRFCSYRTKKDI